MKFGSQTEIVQIFPAKIVETFKTLQCPNLQNFASFIAETIKTSKFFMVLEYHLLWVCILLIWRQRFPECKSLCIGEIIKDFFNNFTWKVVSSMLLFDIRLRSSFIIYMSHFLSSGTSPKLNADNCFVYTIAEFINNRKQTAEYSHDAYAY